MIEFFGQHILLPIVTIILVIVSIIIIVINLIGFLADLMRDLNNIINLIFSAVRTGIISAFKFIVSLPFKLIKFIIRLIAWPFKKAYRNYLKNKYKKELEEKVDILKKEVEISNLKSQKEKENLYNNGIDEETLIFIANKCAKKFSRIKSVSIKDALVHCDVISNTNNSIWSFSLNFNDKGYITGSYNSVSENEQSDIPIKYGNLMSNDIKIYLKKHNV